MVVSDEQKIQAFYAGASDAQNLKTNNPSRYGLTHDDLVDNYIEGYDSVEST